MQHIWVLHLQNGLGHLNDVCGCWQVGDGGSRIQTSCDPILNGVGLAATDSGAWARDVNSVVAEEHAVLEESWSWSARAQGHVVVSTWRKNANVIVKALGEERVWWLMREIHDLNAMWTVNIGKGHDVVVTHLRKKEMNGNGWLVGGRGKLIGVHFVVNACYFFFSHLCMTWDMKSKDRRVMLVKKKVNVMRGCFFNHVFLLSFPTHHQNRSCDLIICRVMIKESVKSVG